MKQKRNLAFVLLPVILAVGIVGGLLISRYGSSGSKSAAQQKLDLILGMIDAEYVDDISLDSLLEASFPDLLAALDPHSVYIPASEFDMANGALEGSFSGVGVSFQIVADTVTVIEVISGGPAEKVGILAGDRIIEADGKKLTGPEVTNEDVFKTLRGIKGSKVVMKIKRRSSAKPIVFDVIRDDIPVNSIDTYYMIDDETGYIKVNTFSRTTYSEFFTALVQLRGKGASKYIIDLRDNGGGYMEPAWQMVNEFLPEGRCIVNTIYRNKANNAGYFSDGNGKFQDVEIVVLTNESSASAAEIFAGAIQDNDRGLVIGRRTFGKGLVQNQSMLPDNSAVRLTVARYYTPSGRCIQKPFERGANGTYELDIADRYNHGEFYNADSIHLDKSKVYRTSTGRKVYGGGGIMPDIFVPQDTLGYTSYLMNVVDRGLIQKFAFNYTDRYRSTFRNVKTVNQLLKVLPNDSSLLESFVNFAAGEGVPARWYYINQSREVLLRQIKAIIARDVLGYSEMNQILNDDDPTVIKALQELKAGNSPKLIKK